MENICAIYLRVSSDPQNPQNQIADVKKFAEALKCKIFEIYVDKESGKHSDRREFQRMMADARAGKFKMLFIWALDRFSREGIKATLTHIEELKEVGVSIRSYQESWLDTSNEGIWPLLVAILSWAANQELKRFAERSMAGKRTMLNDGKLIGCYPPYGYRYFPRDKEKGTYAYFEVDEYEASIVRKIFNWYLKFESILMVVYALKKEGIKGRGKGRIEPGFMQASAVSKILRRETYIGNYYFGKSSPCIAKFHIKSIRKPGLTGRRKNPKSEWKLIRVAEIIEKEIFYKTQEVLEKRAKHRIEMSKYEFLCQGLIRCIDCGKSYGGRMQHGDYLFYRCPQAYSSNVNQPACRSRTMGRDKLDRIVWNFVVCLVNDKNKIKNAIVDLQKKRHQEKFSKEKLVESLSIQKKTIRIKRKNLFDLFSDQEFSESAKADLKIKMKELDEKEQLLDQQILEVKSDLMEIRNTEMLEKEAEEIRKLYKKKIENPSFELKKFTVRKWIEEINIQPDGSVIVKARIPKSGPIDKEGRELRYSQNNLSVAVRFEEAITEI